jgi:hypothetical protein
MDTERTDSYRRESMRRILFGTLLLLAGCATSGADEMLGSGVDAPATKAPTGSGGEFHLQADMVTASLDVQANAEDAWPALLQVYEELEIPAREVNATTRTVRNLRFVVSRRLGGERLATFLDCGRSATGPNANSYRLELEIASRVMAVGANESRIQTEIMGTGMNMEGTSNTRVTCTSNHQLEARIAARVRELVKSPGSSDLR